MAGEIERFRIEVPQSVLDDLRARLARTRFPDEVDAEPWSYGTDLGYLRVLCDYWRDKFDWRAQEALLNRFEQFRTSIDGLGLHFIHARSRHANAFPLVITHGWPGSVYEFVKVIGPLTDPEAHGGRAEDAFHVVCPSIPGYGFSDRPSKPGFDVRAAAELETQLMARLGYARYGAQGGDWGALITTWIGGLDPAHCAGIHLNMVIAGPPSGGNPMEGVTPEEQQDLALAQKVQTEGVGYQAIQGTRPQTLAYGLNDSPAGLAGWIVEKFHAWSDCGGDVERRFSKDELLANITIYWATQTINSSTRFYCENRRGGRYAPAERVEVPTGVAVFKELFRPPRAWAEKRYNIQRWTRMPRGGHFAALEEPGLLVEDIRAFFRTLR